MTTEQLKTLADKLRGTTLNVYTLAKSLFKVEWNDELFAELEKRGGVFKCDECGEWQNVAEEKSPVGDLCNDCVAELDGKMED